MLGLPTLTPLTLQVTTPPGMKGAPPAGAFGSGTDISSLILSELFQLYWSECMTRKMSPSNGSELDEVNSLTSHSYRDCAKGKFSVEEKC